MTEPAEHPWKSRKLIMAAIALGHIDGAMLFGALTGAEFIMGVIAVLTIYGGTNVAASYAFAALVGQRPAGYLPPTDESDQILVAHTEDAPA